MSNIIIADLPNAVPAPNQNNVTGEWDEYMRLYTLLNRTTTGQTTFTSPSSGVTYNTASYSSDSDVNNRGQTGMLNLLYKYVLETYILTADKLQQIINRADGGIIDATVSYSSSVYTLTLSNTPPGNYYTVRFLTPNDYVLNATFRIDGVTYTPRLSNSSNAMPAGTFIASRVLTANVDTVNRIITFVSGGGGAVIYQSGTPTASAYPGQLWLKSSTRTLYYSTGSSWIQIIGVWG